MDRHAQNEKQKQGVTNRHLRTVGNYCDESTYDVRSLLVKWLETRENEYVEYFSIPLRHKNLTMDGWFMQLNDDTQPGDEL